MQLLNANMSSVQGKLMQKQKALTDADVRRILHDEMLTQSGFSTPSQHIGNFRI